MSPKVRCLLDDLRALSTQDVSDLNDMEANDLYIALRLATVSVDAAQVVAGNFDWKDERSRRFDGDKPQLESEEVMATKERPAIVTDEHLEYLDELRESGVTNMFGAAPYVRNVFGVSIEDAREILSYWMATFGQATR